MMNRRNAIKIAGLAAAAVAANSFAAETTAADPKTASTPYPLPDLPYPYEALEPHIDAETMRIHHDFHHQAYATNLRNAVAKHAELAGKPAVELVKHWEHMPEDIRLAVRNSGGGYVNHNLFWQFLSPKSAGEPKGDLAAAIDKQFSNFNGFKEQFSKAALGVFGSGWVWLTMDANKQLRLESTPNQDCPLTMGRVPLLGIDVWEHAYYLKYRNRRADYVKAFFNVIHWEFAAQSFETGVVK